MRSALLPLFAASFVPSIANQQTELPVRPLVVREYTTGPDGLELFGVVAVAIEPKSGALWVLSGKPGDPPIRINRKDGSARTIGRKGGGPDEFTGTKALAPGRDGHMGVFDVLRRTIAWVDSTGRHARTWRTTDVRVADRAFFTDTSGRVFFGVDLPGPIVGGVEGTAQEIAIARFDSARGLVDTTSAGKLSANSAWTSTSTNGDNISRRGHEVPYASHPSWTIDAHGRLYTANGDSSFVTVREHGRTSRIALSQRRDPLTAREKAAVTRSLDWFVAHAGPGRVTYDHPRPPVPNFHPEVDGLIPDLNGGVAVLRSVACDGLPWKPAVKEITWIDRGPFVPRCTLVDRYDGAGRRLRSFALVPDDRLSVVRSDTIWAVRKMEDDTQRIVEMVIPRR